MAFIAIEALLGGLAAEAGVGIGRVPIHILLSAINSLTYLGTYAIDIA